MQPPPLRPDAGSSARPKVRPGVAAFLVADELVLLAPGGEVAHALNESAAGVWRMCDGQHTPLDMLAALSARYDGTNVEILADITAALFRFHDLDLIDLAVGPSKARRDQPAAETPPRVRLLFGIEDTPYFHWQLGILFESLVGQLEPGWDINVVVCNDHQGFSTPLARLFRVYGVRAFTGENQAHRHEIDFSAHRGGYAALNRVEALRAIAEHVDPDDVVCLMDTDLFLYGELRPELFPAGNAMAANAIIADRLFLGRGREDQGIDLQQVLSALGCRRELKRGGVTVFLTGATLANEKVISDCFRFAQIIYLLGKAAGLPDDNLWMSEMACFAMALTANQLDYELLHAPQFAVPAPEQTTLPVGSFFHYYCDINDGFGGPFVDSEWNKQLFVARDFLAENLESFRRDARGDLERRFLDLALAARRRLLESPAA